MDRISNIPDQLRAFTQRSYPRNILVAAVGFALAGITGLLIGGLLLRSPLARLVMSWVDTAQPLQRLVMGLTLFILGMAISGMVLGAIGGWLLTIVDSLAPRRRYIFTGALAFAIPQAILVTLALLAGAILGIYYNNLDTNPIHLPVLFGVFGLFYGMIAGLLLGLVSVGFKYGWGVLLASMLGGLFGGMLVGAVLRSASGLLRMDILFERWWLLLLIFGLFYSAIGLALGIVYTWFHRARHVGGDLPRAMGRYWRIFGVFAIIMVLLNLLGVFSQLYAFATMQPASTSPVLAPESIGVAWSPTAAPEEARPASLSPALAAGPNRTLALAWMQQGPALSQIMLATAMTDRYQQPRWRRAVTLSSPDAYAFHPAIAADQDGNWHIVWVEKDVSAPVSANARIMYARCTDGECTPPQILSQGPEGSCPTRVRSDARPAIAINDVRRIMVVWGVEEGGLAAASWTPDQPMDAPECLSWTGGDPQLAALDGDRFALGFADARTASGNIRLARFQDGVWEAAPEWEQPGTLPVLLSAGPDLYVAWCSPDDRLNVWSSTTNQIETPGSIPCRTRPALALDGGARIHLIWHGDRIENNFQSARPGSFLFESIRTPAGWQTPALVTATRSAVSPALTATDEGSLHLAWQDGNSLKLSSSPFYQCPSETGTLYGDVILQVLRTASFRPPDSPIPFCRNAFAGLAFLPDPPSSGTSAAADADAFDVVAEQIRGARYEVLFATMEWMKDENLDSPGFLFAQAVTDLYRQVRAHPENYPRGVTVRILLGNYPELSTFTFGDQVWNVMDVLQKAGLPELTNPEIGWRVELANFDGQNPHSHAKFLVVDGKQVMAAGFNYSYLHFNRDHPSGLGVSLVDFGLTMQGPVAQDALAAFDDLWSGSTLIRCPDLNPPKGNWARHCSQDVAEATHPPEVLRYHPMPADDTAFALLRTANRPESDRALEALIASTQERIDIFEVNFSLEVYCVLGVLMEDFCSMNDALPYMDALLRAMEERQVRVRVLVTDVNMNGIENSVAIDTFRKELEKRGLSHLAEFRYYTGRMHAKAFLVDDAFLVVGSQNFHYSAWGDGKGLVEFNLATDSQPAIEAFRQAFETYWAESIPVVPGQVRSE